MHKQMKTKKTKAEIKAQRVLSGSKGGKAGTGAGKKRGGVAYHEFYRKLRACPPRGSKSAPGGAKEAGVPLRTQAKAEITAPKPAPVLASVLARASKPLVRVEMEEPDAEPYPGEVRAAEEEKAAWVPPTEEPPAGFAHVPPWQG